MISKKIILLILILLLVSCKHNINTVKFNNIITKNINIKDSTVNFENIFPFDWDKMYIFSREHFPCESDISNITGAKYNGYHNCDDRLILFIKDNKITFEVMTLYKTDDFDDEIAPFKYNFFYGTNSLFYFTKNNAKFKVQKYKDQLLLVPLIFIKKERKTTKIKTHQHYQKFTPTTVNTQGY